jgi:hypothetical protein
MSVARVWFWASVAAFVFVYGVAVGHYEIFPYRAIEFAKDSVVQVYEERGNLLGTRPVHFLDEARHEGDGARLVEPSKAAPGLTLITGFFGETSALRLIRLDGSVVAEWRVRYFDFFPDTAHVQPPDRVPATNWNTDIHGAVALADGSVVFNFEFGGLVKLDRCGKTVWTLPRMTHHSVDESADGGFWVPSRRYREKASEFAPIAAPYFDNTILKVSAAGAVEREISVTELLFANALEGLLVSNGDPDPFDAVNDLGHLNDVEELPASKAARFPAFEAGDLLISLRDLHLVLVFDPDSLKVKWHQTGPWLRQHDPDFEDDGTISIFDNHAIARTRLAELRRSRIVAVDPTTGATRTLYGDGEEPMFTSIRGKHQLLPNGNLLMTEFAAGRILEVDTQGKLLWEYVNRYDAETVAEVSQATRYPEQFFTAGAWDCQVR